MRSSISLLLALVLLPSAAQAYMPLDEFLRAQLQNDPLVLEDDIAPDEDPLLNENIFDENGDWIESIEPGSGDTEEPVGTSPVTTPPASQTTPTQTQTTTRTNVSGNPPPATQNGQRVFYRGGEVFLPGDRAHSAAETEEATTSTTTGSSTESVADSAIDNDNKESETGTGRVKTSTGALIESETTPDTQTGSTTATGAVATDTDTEDTEESAQEPTERRSSSPFANPIFMGALAIGSIVLGIMVLKFKGGGVIRRSSGNTAPANATQAAPAQPATEESKLQQAIDDMKGGGK